MRVFTMLPITLKNCIGNTIIVAKLKKLWITWSSLLTFVFFLNLWFWSEISIYEHNAVSRNIEPGRMRPLVSTTIEFAYDATKRIYTRHNATTYNSFLLHQLCSIDDGQCQKLKMKMTRWPQKFVHAPYINYRLIIINVYSIEKWITWLEWLDIVIESTKHMKWPWIKCTRKYAFCSPRNSA